MAYERTPIFKFKTKTETGIDEVPVGSSIMIEETTEIFTKNSNENLTSSTTIKDAITLGILSDNISNTNIFNFLYYADEQDSTPENPNGTNSRVLGMNPKTMKLEKEIKLRPYSHPGSCDRAAFSDKMYVRTATTHYDPERYFGVIDMVEGKWIKSVPLNYKPRSSGAYNRYRDMHAITTKERPWIHLIDCPTDTIIFSDGDDNPTYPSAQGNDGGNATGHAVWLDANHFALLDRHNVNIQVYKIEGTYPPYTVTKTQTISTPTGCHSLRSFESGLLLKDRVFFAAIEGAFNEDIPDHPPEMWKMTFDSSTSQLSSPDVVTFNGAGTGGADDNIHHFGVATINGRKIVGVPLTRSSTVRFIDVDTWQLADGTNGTDNLHPAAGYYSVGTTSSAKPGHCDFCTNGGLQVMVTTNHSGKTASVIDLDTKTVTEVAIPSLTNYTEGTGFTMSHANHVIGTNYYFFDAYYNESTGNKGTFYELDLTTNTITRSCVTGGHPVQSFS
jgi:hypothetical protein